MKRRARMEEGGKMTKRRRKRKKQSKERQEACRSLKRKCEKYSCSGFIVPSSPVALVHC